MKAIALAHEILPLTYHLKDFTLQNIDDFLADVVHHFAFIPRRHVHHIRGQLVPRKGSADLLVFHWRPGHGKPRAIGAAGQSVDRACECTKWSRSTASAVAIWFSVPSEGVALPRSTWLRYPVETPDAAESCCKVIDSRRRCVRIRAPSRLEDLSVAALLCMGGIGDLTTGSHDRLADTVHQKGLGQQ